jgi:hypothetical protein
MWPRPSTGKGRLTRAERLYSRALAVFERAYEPEQHGEEIARGAIVGYLGNFALEEELADVQAELPRSQVQLQFELAAPHAGSVFGEDLPRMVGQYFQKGAEICRVADTRQLLVRI